MGDFAQPGSGNYARRMSEPNPELLILAITLIALALAPLASRLVGRIGDQISSELDGGRTGEELHDHLDASYEGAAHGDEIAQMLEARAFLRGEADSGAADAAAADQAALREEARQVVVASNERRVRMGEQPVDVEAEVTRMLAAGLGEHGRQRT